MQKVSTLYSSYAECMLDIAIFGRILSAQYKSLEERKQALFEEFKLHKPAPTLEDKRYELSRHVSSDYNILYDNDMILQDNEELFDLHTGVACSPVDMSDAHELPEDVTLVFSYENGITDDFRAEIIKKYDLDTGEEFKIGVSEENNDDEMAEDGYISSASGSEYEVEDFDGDEEDSEEYVDSDDLSSYASEDDDLSSYMSDDESEDFEDFEDDEEEYEESEDFEDDDESEEYENDDELDGFEDDSSSADFDDNEESEDFEDDYDEESEDFEDDDDEESEDFEDDDDEESEDFEDDYSEESEDFEDDYSEDDEESFGDYEEDDESEDYEDEGDYEEDDEFEDYEDEGDYEEDDESEDDLENYADAFDDEDISDEVAEAQSGVPSFEESQQVVDLGVDSDIDMSEMFTPDDVVSPVSSVKDERGSPSTIEMMGGRGAEPIDLRQFLRKYPRSEISFVRQYFSQKQIDEALKRGKIIKKGNILRI